MTAGCVFAPSGVAKKSERSIGSVLDAGRIALKRSCAGGCIVIRGVRKKGASANGRVKASARVAPKRKVPNAGVEAAGCKAKKRVLPFRRITAGIASIRRWTNRSRVW
jgi:hypothetical protein